MLCVIRSPRSHPSSKQVFLFIICMVRRSAVEYTMSGQIFVPCSEFYARAESCRTCLQRLHTSVRAFIGVFISQSQVKALFGPKFREQVRMQCFLRGTLISLFESWAFAEKFPKWQSLCIVHHLPPTAFTLLSL